MCASPDLLHLYHVSSCANNAWTMKNLQAKKQYDLVQDDGYDSRIPLHNEEAFQHGLSFPAKYIGTLDVPRPSSRVEIVAAMRRIRYEFKAKAIKKKKINIIVSIDGVKVALARKKRKTLVSNVPWESNQFLVMQHPIYRIFYVSHDSQDLKIFSYIARDGSTNLFKCNVFKAYKKNQAMRIVRTIGQAFEVCHKISATTINPGDDTLDKKAENGITNAKKHKSPEKTPSSLSSATSTSVAGAPEIVSPQSPQSPAVVLQQARALLQSVEPPPGQTAGTISSPSSPGLDEPSCSPQYTSLSTHHQLQLLQQQLEQQQQHTQVALAQVTLVRDQLAAETAARLEAQARTHQLLVQNRELLQHINTLVGRLQYLEVRVPGSSSPHTLYTDNTQTVPALGDVCSPGPADQGPVGLYENTHLTYADSPDSGHREMSSDSLAGHTSTNSTPTTLADTPYTQQGAMSANNRPALNLPLPSNPATIPATNGYLQDNNQPPKINPPPKVNRKSSRTPSLVKSPDANGNPSVSPLSSIVNGNSFEMQLNHLLEQATSHDIDLEQHSQQQTQSSVSTDN